MFFGDIIIFSDLAIDTRFVVELVGASDLKPFDPFSSVFQTNRYLVAIDGRQYYLNHTAGIPSSRTGRSSLRAPDVSDNLFVFISRLIEVHLLIYVVDTDKPTSDNFRFFYDYVCQQDAPIILVQTTHTPSELSWFDLVLTLDGADPESDKVNLHKAITKHLNRNPKFIPPFKRFDSAARGCWKLLGKEASWSLADFRNALKLIHTKGGRYKKVDVDAICERIIEQVSVGDNIQQRVDAILSTIIAVGNVTSIPFLSVATESIVNIGETVQVCATTFDLWS
jgi:hypothetical protein